MLWAACCLSGCQNLYAEYHTWKARPHQEPGLQYPGDNELLQALPTRFRCSIVECNQHFHSALKACQQQAATDMQVPKEKITLSHLSETAQALAH